MVQRDIVLAVDGVISAPQIIVTIRARNTQPMENSEEDGPLHVELESDKPATLQ